MTAWPDVRVAARPARNGSGRTVGTPEIGAVVSALLAELSLRGLARGDFDLILRWVLGEPGPSRPRR